MMLSLSARASSLSPGGKLCADRSSVSSLLRVKPYMKDPSLPPEPPVPPDPPDLWRQEIDLLLCSYCHLLQLREARGVPPLSLLQLRSTLRNRFFPAMVGAFDSPSFSSLVKCCPCSVYQLQSTILGDGLMMNLGFNGCFGSSQRNICLSVAVFKWCLAEQQILVRRPNFCEIHRSLLFSSLSPPRRCTDCMLEFITKKSAAELLLTAAAHVRSTISSSPPPSQSKTIPPSQ